MAHLTRNWRIVVEALAVLVVGAALGMAAVTPITILCFTVALGVAFLLVHRFRPLWYAPLYVPVLMAFSVALAGIAMWLSVLVLAGAAAYQIIRHRTLGLDRAMRSVTWWWGCFLAARLVSALLSPYRTVALQNTMDYLRLFVVFLLTYYAIRPINLRSFITHAVLGSGLLSGVLLVFYWRYYGGFHWLLIDRNLKLTLWQQQVNLNVITYLLGLVAAPGAALLLELRGWGKRTVVGAALVAVIMAVAFSASRASAVFVLAQGGLLLVWLLFRRKPRRALNLVLLAAGTMFLGCLLLYMGIPAGFGDSRNLLRDVSWEKFVQAPILGWGPGTYTIGLEQYVLLSELRRQTGLDETLAGQAHNFIMNNLPDIGIVGTAVMLVLFVVLIVLVRRRILKLSTLSVAIFVMILSMPIRGLFETSGLFGAANGLADLLSWVWVAVALRSLQADEEGAAT